MKRHYYDAIGRNKSTLRKLAGDILSIMEELPAPAETDNMVQWGKREDERDMIGFDDPLFPGARQVFEFSDPFAVLPPVHCRERFT